MHSFKTDYIDVVGSEMSMLRVHSMSDLLSLPETKWKIKQPADDDTSREDALETGSLISSWFCGTCLFCELTVVLLQVVST